MVKFCCANTLLMWKDLVLTHRYPDLEPYSFAWILFSLELDWRIELVWQEPLLAFPFRFCARLGDLPTQPRRLKATKPAKKKDYLSLCQALLNAVPTEATKRSVKFLIKICNGSEAAEAPPPLQWLQDFSVDAVPPVVGLPSELGRLAPLMRFRANVRP